MPAKPNFEDIVKSKHKHNSSSSVIYEKITDKSIDLAPSAWTVFQEFLKGGFKSNKPKQAKENEVSNFEDKTDNFSFKGSSNFSELKQTKKILNIDIIWSGIAFGCLLGTVYFLFGGLQPLVLKNYISSSKSNIDSIGVSFVSQVNILSTAQTSIIQNTSYNILSDCTAEQKYLKLEQDIAQIDLAERSLFPNQEFKSVPKFNQLSETEVREEYSNFYQYYSQSLNNLKNSVLEDIRYLPRYTAYRNNWIDSCIVVADVNSSKQQVIESCNQLALSTDEFLQNQGSNGIWSDVKKPIEANLSLCSQLESGQGGNFIDWKLKWLSGYGEITSFIPNSQKNIDKINNTVQDLKTESVRYKNKLNNIYDRKVSLVGMWYLLEF